MQTLYFNQEDVKELHSIGGLNALVLMQYYVAIAHRPNPNMEDSHVSKLIFTPITTIRDVRLKLTKAGWFKRVKTTIKGKPHIIYYVGKSVIQTNFPSIAVLNIER